MKTLKKLVMWVVCVTIAWAGIITLAVCNEAVADVINDLWWIFDESTQVGIILGTSFIFGTLLYVIVDMINTLYSDIEYFIVKTKYHFNKSRAAKKAKKAA